MVFLLTIDEDVCDEYNIIITTRRSVMTLKIKIVLCSQSDCVRHSLYQQVGTSRQFSIGTDCRS